MLSAVNFSNWNLPNDYVYDDNYKTILSARPELLFHMPKQDWTASSSTETQVLSSLPVDVVHDRWTIIVKRQILNFESIWWVWEYMVKISKQATALSATVLSATALTLFKGFKLRMMLCCKYRLKWGTVT